MTEAEIDTLRNYCYICNELNISAWNYCVDCDVDGGRRTGSPLYDIWPNYDD